MTDPININPNASIDPSSGVQKPQQNKALEGQSFADALQNAQTDKNALNISKHAQKRLEKRNLNLNDDSMARLLNAVERAENRGGKDSLVLMDNMAFIVNVENRTVITALDVDNKGEGVFTRIDSVVIADSEDTSKE